MPKPTYLICMIHPFERTPLLLLKHDNEIHVHRHVSYLNKYQQIISFGFSQIIDWYRSNKIDNLPEIIDVETATKLTTGKPKSTFKLGNEQWTLKNILGNKIQDRSHGWLSDFFKLKIVEPEKTEDFHEIVKDIMGGFEKAWNELNKELKSKGEEARFYEIETPVYNLFIKTQLNGILVPQENLYNKLHELKSLMYSHLKILELEYNFTSQSIKSKMEWSNISQYCSLKNIKEDLDYDFWKFAEIYSEYDKFLYSLVNARCASIDYYALIKYTIDTYQRIYPHFDILGTVTGRILVTSPGIQYLKKTSRSIFKPNEGHVLLYADFDRFEPGIIASFSNDQKLVKLYNNGDIYNELGLLLFGNKDKRKLAKVIFLAYMYGMARERLEKFITDIAGEDAKEKGIKFFGEFKVLCKWKDAVCNEARANGYSRSIYGNRRYLDNKGQLLGEEKRWIPNQIIQGTASYIFKKSLLELGEREKELKFLIPMHDAILLEVPSAKEKKVKESIQDIFNNEFQKVCPGIQTSISFEKFSV